MSETTLGATFGWTSLVESCVFPHLLLMGCYMYFRGFATFGTQQYTEENQMLFINHSGGVVSHKIIGIKQTINISINDTLTNKDGFWASARAAPLIQENKNN